MEPESYLFAVNRKDFQTVYSRLVPRHWCCASHSRLRDFLNKVLLTSSAPKLS